MELLIINEIGLYDSGIYARFDNSHVTESYLRFNELSFHRDNTNDDTCSIFFAGEFKVLLYALIQKHKSVNLIRTDDLNYIMGVYPAKAWEDSYLNCNLTPLINLGIGETGLKNQKKYKVEHFVCKNVNTGGFWSCQVNLKNHTDILSYDIDSEQKIFWTVLLALSYRDDIFISIQINENEITDISSH